MTEQPPALRASSLALRALSTLVLYCVYAFLNHLLNPVATLAAGKAAGGQLAADDVSYVTSTYGMKLAPQLGIPFLVFLLLVVWIWWKPGKALIAALTTAALVLTLATSAQPASAYYDKTNYPEVYWVAPNESAFYLPDVGDNKTSQTEFGSEAYYRENKIAVKRFDIPHTKLAGSSYTFDFFVPAGRLIIVDRAPYAREWRNKGGTGDGNESLQCQSKGGHDITVEISIAASVFEKDAPRFLYRFGIRPIQGNRDDPQVKWQSVFQGKNLTEAMDTVVKGKLQSLLCKYFSVRTVDEINADAEIIINGGKGADGKDIIGAEDEVREYLIKEFGITLDYIGWGSTFEYDPIVQKALNDRYAADKIAPVMATLERLATIRALEGLSDGLKAHGLPSNLVVLPGNIAELGKMLLPAPSQPAATFVPNIPAAPARP